MSARERFEQLDREVHAAFVETLTATTSFSPLGGHSPQTNWGPFNRAANELRMLLEERHAVKHMATREAEISCGPVVVAVEPAQMPGEDPACGHGYAHWGQCPMCNSAGMPSSCAGCERDASGRVRLHRYGAGCSAAGRP